MSQTLRVLLLEDCQDDARLILHELRHAGFEPTGDRVETEPEFIAQLGTAPDIILADYNLPQFDALRALDMVRQRGLDVPVIIVTGALGDEAAVECVKRGAADYLLKDRLARLGQAVTHALDQKQARDERRRTEEALHESEAFTTAILETALDGIITFEERGIIASLNPAAERLFGYSASATIGQNVRMLMPPPDPEEPDLPLDRYLTTGSKNRIGTAREMVGRKNDGTTFPMELTVSEVQLGDRRIFTGIVRDITERKHAELELTRRAHELARSNVELEKFAYVASHDLQEPLRMVGSFTQLLARRYGDQLDTTAKEFIGYIVDGATRMQTLINDLLAYSRVGTRGADFQLINCQDVLDRVLANLKSSIDETRTVVTHGPLPSSPGRCHSDGAVVPELDRKRDQVPRRHSAPDRARSPAPRRGVALLRPRSRHRFRPQARGPDLRHLPASPHSGPVPWHRYRPGDLQEDRRATRGPDLGRVRAGPRFLLLLHDPGPGGW